MPDPTKPSGSYPASRHKAETQRRRVLAESTLIFSRHGYRASSMNDIAAAVGLSKPTLYHYFANKQELLVRLYSDMLDESLEMGAQTVAAAQSPLAAIRDLVASRVVYTCRNQALLKVCFEEEHELPAQLAQALLDRRRAFEDLFQSVLEEHLRHAPEALSGMSPTVFTNMCLGAANWCYKSYRPDGPATPEQLGEQIADWLTASLDPANGHVQLELDPPIDW